MHTPKSSYVELSRSTCWAQPHIREDDEQGAYQHLMSGEFAKILFVYILRKIDPVIARFETHFRKSISSAEKFVYTILSTILLSINI